MKNTLGWKNIALQRHFLSIMAKYYTFNLKLRDFSHGPKMSKVYLKSSAIWYLEVKRDKLSLPSYGSVF